MDAVDDAPWRVLHLMHAQEPRLHQAAQVFPYRQRSRQAVPPFFRIVDEIVRHRLIRDDVRDRKPPAGTDDPVHLAEHLGLVRREVNHAIGNDEINAAILDREILCMAFAELDVRCGIAEVRHHDRRVAPGHREHLLGHVHTDHPAGLADAPASLKAIDSPARADVQHRLAKPHRRQASRRAAPVRDAQHFLWDEGSEVVEVVARRAAHLLAASHGPGVPLVDLLRDRLVRHMHLAVDGS